MFGCVCQPSKTSHTRLNSGASFQKARSHHAAGLSSFRPAGTGEIGSSKSAGDVRRTPRGLADQTDEGQRDDSDPIGPRISERVEKRPRMKKARPRWHRDGLDFARAVSDRCVRFSNRFRLFPCVQDAPADGLRDGAPSLGVTPCTDRHTRLFGGVELSQTSLETSPTAQGPPRLGVERCGGAHFPRMVREPSGATVGAEVEHVGHVQPSPIQAVRAARVDSRTSFPCSACW